MYDQAPHYTPEEEANAKSWAPQVKTVNDDAKWYGNALRFATKAEAHANVHDLMMRWMLVTDTRAVPTQDPVSHVWNPETGLEAAP